MPTPLHVVLVLLAAILDGRQRRVIAYLQAENRVLGEQLGRRPSLTDPQRRRVAVAAKALERAGLRTLETIHLVRLGEFQAPGQAHCDAGGSGCGSGWGRR